MKQRIASSASAFFTVLFEYTFVFLLGFFVGGGCTLFYAVYIVAQAAKRCESGHQPSQQHNESQSENKEGGQGSCYTTFFVFITLCGSLALFYVLFKAYRYYQETTENMDSKGKDTQAKDEETNFSSEKLDDDSTKQEKTKTLI